MGEFSYGEFNDSGKHPIIKFLSDIQSWDLKLLNPWCSLYFTQTPQINEHNFVITFYEGEEQISAEFTLLFY